MTKNMACVGDLRAIRRWGFFTHNARGMAMLSAYEALKILEAQDTLMLDTALGGIGGCPYSKLCFGLGGQE